MSRRPAYQRPADDFKRGRTGPWPGDKPPPEVVAAKVRYVANGEHKNYPSPDGMWTMASRSHKAKCDQYRPEDWRKIQDVLRAAIVARCVDEDFRGVFPSRAWAYINGVLHEARLSNLGQGEYHGFPLEYVEQYPDDPGGLLRNAPHVTIP